MPVELVASRHFETHTPILIVGAGACGLTAALAAKDGGADVVVLERDAVPAGSTAMSYGAICAAGSRLQRDAGISDDPDLLAEDILTITRGQTDADLATLIARESAPAIEWLVDEHGIDLTVETSWTGMGHCQPRLHAPADRTGQTLMGMLQSAASRADVDILTEARVTRIFANDDGRVLGVAAQRPDDAVEEIACDVLIIATCGFGANRDWVAEHMPAVANARYYGHEGNDGDGIAWGIDLGGATADMGAYQALGSLADPQSIVIPHTLMIGGGIQVNANGERFENELDDISGQALTILEQPDGHCWIVYDERLHRAALERFQDYRDADSMRAPKRADTPAGLASATGLPAAALEATLAAIESYARDSATDDFGRRFSPEQRLEAPYYAIRVTGALFHTQGGLIVDADARVVREDGMPLPNVYAGGGAARSVSGPAEWGYLPGMGLCTAVTLGRVAGRAAAKQVQE